MGDGDYILSGSRADVWHNVIGELGDEYRQALLNPIVVSVLNEVASRKVQGPQSILAAALASLPLERFGSEENWQDSLLKWHADTANLQEEFPHISTAKLLDLGCGNGYLGNWLAQCGTSYFGIEPSEQLIAYANTKKSEHTARFEKSTIQQFCDPQATDTGGKPSLISVLAVFDQCTEPSSVLELFSEFLHDKEWSEVPILVATLDPDFFLPGLPATSHTVKLLNAYGIEEELSLRDPASWEEMFSKNGFFVLEQRPVHISSLPKKLAIHIHRHHVMMHPNPTGRILPRQGPFYMWLLSRRSGKRIANPTAAISEKLLSDSWVPEEHEANSDLEMIGNLGGRAQAIISGAAEYRSQANELEMPFPDQSIFGQMEISGNYFSSRILGSLKSVAHSNVQYKENSNLFDFLEKSNDDSHRLFFSMMKHLDSVKYDRFITKSRWDSDIKSTVIRGHDISLLPLQYLSAKLLKTCSLEIANGQTDIYRSRILVKLLTEKNNNDPTKIDRNRQSELSKHIYAMVRSNIIDCFNTAHFNHFERDGRIFQDEISTIEFSELQESNAHHIGWQVANYLLFQSDFCLDSGNFDNVQDAAVCISAMLNCEKDLKIFKKDNQTRHGTLEAKIKNISNILNIEYSIVQPFLNGIFEAFDFKPQYKERARLGVSDYIVVRDVWGLLACLLDANSMFSVDIDELNTLDFHDDHHQKERMFSYFQEVIDHIGRTTGLTKSPWREPVN